MIAHLRSALSRAVPGQRWRCGEADYGAALDLAYALELEREAGREPWLGDDEDVDPELAALLAYEDELERWLDENAPEPADDGLTLFVGFPEQEGAP